MGLDLFPLKWAGLNGSPYSGCVSVIAQSGGSCDMWGWFRGPCGLE